MDGTVIGGCGHGRVFDPDKTGPVLVIPKPIKLASRTFADGAMPSAEPVMDREDYRLHQFSYRDDYDITQRVRLWMPLEIKPHMAMTFLIRMAASAKPTNA